MSVGHPVIRSIGCLVDLSVGQSVPGKKFGKEKKIKKSNLFLIYIINYFIGNITTELFLMSYVPH